MQCLKGDGHEASILSSEDDDTDDDNDGDFGLYSRIPVREDRPDRARGNPYTEDETQAMVDFLANQGLTSVSSHAGKSYWRIFYHLVSSIIGLLFMQRANGIKESVT